MTFIQQCGLLLEMKATYIKKRFGQEALSLIETINGILDDYRSQGYDLSLRQLYYQLVSKNIVPNEEKSYKNVGGLVSDARLAGLVDWDMIKDRGREMVCNPHWQGTSHFLESVAPQFQVDLWEGQCNYVEVMVEKQALEGVLEPVCRRLDIPFTANKGYSSSSAMYEAGRRMYEKLRDEKQIYIIYLGDHDPSGIDMSRDVLDRLRMFSECDEGDTVKVEVNRVALNMAQVEEMNPPENPAKITDSRAAAYIRRFGTSSWELDAIEPRQLASLVTDTITSLLDVPLFNRRKKEQERVRKELLKLAKQYKAE